MDNKIIPPPPVAAKPRNESMNSSLPTYRNRPSGSSASSSSNPLSQFANAKSLFESLNTPAIRNGVTQLAKNPLAQRAAVALAKNDTVRNTAVNAAHKAATGKEADPLVSQMANVCIKEKIKEFESKPIMGMASGGTAGDRTSQTFTGNTGAFGQTSYESKTESTYKNLTAIDPFEYPPQLPSTYPHQFPSLSAASSSDNYANRSKSTEPYGGGYGAAGGGFSSEAQKKPAPSRPPPPKMANSWSNPSLASPEVANRAHAIAKYPYKSAHADELSFDPGDTLLLEREVDDQWVAAVNTRTGLSGIVPLAFLDIKIPLAPSSSSNRMSSAFGHGTITAAAQPASFASHTSTATQLPTLGSKQVMKALYDYNSGVDGDLVFNAGDLIVVHESVGNDWYNGELRGKFGIFPATYAQPTSGAGSGGSAPIQSAPSLAKTVTALYDYASEVAEDLQFRAHDVIEVVEEVNAEWIRGRLNGRVGLVPLTYVQRNY